MKAFIAAALLCPLLAWAGDKTEKIEKTETRVEERQRAETAATVKQREIIAKLRGLAHYRTELAKLGQINGGSREVVALGEKYVKTYGGLEQAVVDYVKYYGTNLPDPAPYTGVEFSGEPASFDELRALKGKPFDRAFLTRLWDGNEKMIKVLDEAKRGSADKRFNSLLDRFMNHIRDSQTDYRKIWPDVTTS